MIWTFKAVHEDPVQPVDTSGPRSAVRADVPKTGEASHSFIIGLTIVAGCCTIGLIVYKISKRKRRILDEVGAVEMQLRMKRRKNIVEKNRDDC